MFKKNFTVLLVDDETTARKLIGERISKIPNVTLAASLANGFSAKKYLLEHQVDIVITDIKMPLMDGLELAAFIKEYAPHCPIVIISGYDEFEYARQAIQYGVKEYLLKPIKFQKIVEVVEKLCNEVHARRESTLRQVYNEDIKLENQLYQMAVNGTLREAWSDMILKQMPQVGIVVRVEAETIGMDAREASIKYKNILQEILHGYHVLRFRWRPGMYEFLLLREELKEHLSLLAVPEYLGRVLEKNVVWTEVCNVNSIEELTEISISAKKEDKNEAILFACNYMKEHLSEPLTRYEVAANVYLSPSYFGHMFKKQMGIGYNEYLSELRVTKAKQLLKSNMAIRDVAVAVGFHDAKYFSDIFYKRTGYIPSEWRRALLAGKISEGDTYEEDLC